jgi:sulfite exporter TauE/SafE
MRILAYLLMRFSEPSSYAGLGALLALLGWNLPETVLGQLVQGLAGACALLALVLKDRGAVPAIAAVIAASPALAPETRPIAPSDNPA